MKMRALRAIQVPAISTFQQFEGLHEYLNLAVGGFSWHVVEGYWKNPKTGQVITEQMRQYEFLGDTYEAKAVASYVYGAWPDEQGIFFATLGVGIVLPGQATLPLGTAPLVGADAIPDNSELQTGV